MRKVNENSLVVQANNLIEAQYSLTVQEKKLILYLVSQIDKNDVDFTIYRINVTDFQNIIGIESSKNHGAIKKVTERLLNRKSFSIEENGRLLQVNWLASADYQKGTIEIEISKKLKPYLLKLSKLFTPYRLKNAIHLKSFYSIRLYELLKQYENIGERTFEIMELRATLGLDSKKYPLYANFKQRVIVVAQKELKEKSDIQFEIFEKKKGRKIASIKFIITPNEQSTEKRKAIEETINNELYKRLTNYFCLSDKQALQVLKNNDDVYIYKILKYVETEIKKGKIENIPAYTLKALKENYYVQKSLFDVEKAENKENEKLKKLKINDFKLLKDDYDKFKEKIADNLINELSEPEQQELETNSVIHVKEKFQRFVKNRTDLDKENLWVRMIMRGEIIKDKNILSINDFFQNNKLRYKYIDNIEELLETEESIK